jgi:LacI family transcriptional regulator
MNRKVKLSDIAKELGVSVPLVSFVMSGKWKENRVSEELAKKVKEMADKMGYQANTTARALRTGKTGVIGLVVADISNPFYGKIAREIENEATKLGFQLMFASSDEKFSKFKEVVETLIGKQVDGLIVVPVKGSDEFLKTKQKQGVKIIQIDRFFKDINLPYVVDDNYYGGEILTNLLIDKGYKKITSVVIEGELSNYKERVESFIDTSTQKGFVSVKDLIIEVPDRDYENILEQKLLSAIENGTDAFFFTQNKLGISGLKIFKNNSITIPYDIAMVSYDNPELFELSNPPISCYQQPIKEIAATSIMLLQKVINNNKEFQKENRISGELIFRESC